MDGDFMVSVPAVSKAMKGMGFPTNKQKCVDWAKQHNASPDVVEALEHMQGNRFRSMSDIWFAIK